VLIAFVWGPLVNKGIRKGTVVCIHCKALSQHELIFRMFTYSIEGKTFIENVTTSQIGNSLRRNMSKKYFVNFVSEPKNDRMKTIVGIACTARAITEGHEVSVFFAASGTRLLEADYIKELDKEMGPDSKAVTEMMGVITSKATLYCSFASVKATLGHSEGDGALIVPDEKITWSGPPGVIELSSASEIQLMY
jgi:predicted peroxiredoxin